MNKTLSILAVDGVIFLYFWVGGFITLISKVYFEISVINTFWSVSLVLFFIFGLLGNFYIALKDNCDPLRVMSKLFTTIIIVSLLVSLASIA
jgi:hypothetical protein